MNKQIFFPQVAEQTIYFPLFAETFFFAENIAYPPEIKWSAPYMGYSFGLRFSQCWNIV